MGEPRACKRPSYQYYPSDEESEPGIRLISLAAFGLWRRMLNAMHVGAPYGHLTTPTGEAIAAQQLARLVGATPRIISRLLGELERAGVFSRTDDGVIYSRRMVRDEYIRNARAAGGELSLEHPNVPRPKDRKKDARKHGAKDAIKDGAKDTFDGSFRGSPSSSSSSSSSSSLQQPASSTSSTDNDGAVDRVLAHYLTVHPKRRPGPNDGRAITRALAAGYSEGDVIAAIDGNAADLWHREHRKHELTYTLRDNGKIDNFREIAATTGQPLGEATPPSGNPVANGRHAFQRKTIAGGARNLPAIKTWLDRKEKPHGD